MEYFLGCSYDDSGSGKPGVSPAPVLLPASQDVALDEDEEDDEEEDLVSESEEEDAFDADGAADEDGNLGDEEDADGEVDDAYLKRLERESRRLKVGHAQCLACSFHCHTSQCLCGRTTGRTQHLCTDEEGSKHVQL